MHGITGIVYLVEGVRVVALSRDVGKHRMNRQEEGKEESIQQ